MVSTIGFVAKVDVTVCENAKAVFQFEKAEAEM
jgi:hypothetical protein